ncbi:MAG: TolC family outer membrane protein [Coxiellaceae bacterium]|nr:TolC family outer membrane protein [Coxiellaceae bacterium]
MKKLDLLIATSACIFCIPLYADTLSSSYALALQNDHNYQRVVNQNKAITEDTAINRGHLLPQLSTSGSYQSEYNTSPNNTAKNEQWTVDLRQPLINVGLWQQLRAAKKNQAAAELSIAAGRQALMLRVAKSYFTLASAKQTLQINQQQLQAQKKLLLIAQHYFKAGKSISTDVSSANAAYKQSQVTAINSKNQLQVSQSSLATITGKLTQKIALVTYNPKLKTPSPNTVKPWVTQAKNANLAAQSDRYKMLAAMDDIKLAEAGHYPTLNASASYQNFHGNNNVIGTTNNRGTTVGLNLDFPIFSGGSVVAQTKKATYTYQASSQAWQADVANAADQARQSFQSIVNDIAQINALNQTIRVQQKALTDIIRAYEGGLRSMNDVLNQQTVLYSSKRQLISARYDYLYKQLTLKNAVGTLNVQDIDRINQLFNKHESHL